MQDNILYTFRRCPYAIRARWALLSTNQKVIWREVSLSNKPSELLKISPKATVPVLKTKEGLVLQESIDIMRWTLENNDHRNILCSDDFEAQEFIQTLIEQNDNVFKYHLDRYKYADRFVKSEKEYHKIKSREILLEWNEIILTGFNDRYFLNNKESLADWCIWPFVRQYRLIDTLAFDTDTELSALKIWLRNYLDDPQFTQLMQKSSPWIPGEMPKFFPLN